MSSDISSERKSELKEKTLPGYLPFKSTKDVGRCETNSFPTNISIENCGTFNVNLITCQGFCWSSSMVIYDPEKNETKIKKTCFTCQPTGYKMVEFTPRCQSGGNTYTFEIKTITSCKCKKQSHCRRKRP